MNQDSYCDTLFINGIVVTMDDQRRVIPDGAVAVRGQRIVAVGPSDELQDWTAARRIDCRGSAVIPGLIDCHNHLFQLAGRGLGDGMALWQWLGEYMLPLAANIQAPESLAAVRVAALEALSCGTTTLLDNHYAPSDVETTLGVARALQEVGLRGIVARGMFGPYTPVARDNGLDGALFQHDTADEIASMRECLQEWSSNRVSIWPSPINVIYNDQALVRSCAELAKEFGVRWQTHCSEAAADPEIYKGAYGMRPFVWMRDQGLLDTDATFAHAIWLDEEEISIVGEHQCGIAHNPMSNQYLASGAMPLRKLRQAGVSMGLGADGAAGHCMDLFQIMKQAVYVQRQALLDPRAGNALEAFELATREGARLTNVDAGQLSEGKLADIVVVNMDKPSMAPCFDVVATLVYAGSGNQVSHTMVDGQIVYERGRFTQIDGDAILEEAQRRCSQLVQRLGLQYPLSPVQAHQSSVVPAPSVA